MTGFDMVRQPWVPVLIEGRREDLSLRDTLLQAHQVEGLAVDDPLEAVAVFRQVLLPVVLDALGLPRSEEEWGSRWEAGRLDADTIATYLEEHVDCFDLFHSECPFAQVAGLRTDRDETKPVSLLQPAIATGNNVPLFCSRTEADPPTLSPGAAVRLLLAAHCWDTAAIKTGALGDPRVTAGKTTGNPTGPLGRLGVVIPIGRTLAETIVLSTPIVPQGLRRDDRPQWRAAPFDATWAQRPALGLLDLLTWQSRRIRLVPDDDGRQRPVVRRVVLAAGDRLDPIPDYEPHTAWRQEQKPAAGQPPRRPLRHRPGVESWRGMAALLATRQAQSETYSTSPMLQQAAELQMADIIPEDFPLQVLTVGVTYGNQSAVVEDVVVDSIPLPVAALTAGSPVGEFLLDVTGQADGLRIAANRLGDEVRRASGGETVPWDRGQRFGDLLIHELGPIVRRMLSGLQREPDRIDEAEAAWRRTAQRIALEQAEPVLASAPPSAFLGRAGDSKWSLRVSSAEAKYRRAVRTTLGITGSRRPVSAVSGKGE